jgi:hypothetical protein
MASSMCGHLKAAPELGGHTHHKVGVGVHAEHAPQRNCACRSDNNGQRPGPRDVKAMPRLGIAGVRVVVAVVHGVKG